MLPLEGGQGLLRVYEIGAASGGRSLALGTTDTASDALQKLRRALDEYGRAWVTDYTGADVSLEELTARAGEETRFGRSA